MAEQNDSGNGIDDSPLSPAECRRLRRMLQDDLYARQFRTTVKVWIISIGAAGTVVATGKVIFWDFLKSFLK